MLDPVDAAKASHFSPTPFNDRSDSSGTLFVSR
jgi:hypothetical protein